MKNKRTLSSLTYKIVILSFCFFCSSNLFSQEKDPGFRNVVQNEIAEKISKYYLDPDVAEKMVLFLQDEKTIKKYENLNEEEFAIALTSDLRLVGNDKHFYVRYLGTSPQFKVEAGKKEQTSLDSITNSLENFGFSSVKRLKGNIGYINYIGFAEPESSKIALTATMNFVSSTNSLIIDLRENRGGDGNMLLLFCSYFLKDSTKVSDTYYRYKNENIENWTTTKVDGAKYLNKDIYFLTSKETFSSGEALPYILQNLNLAKVVGEKTGGAANPVDPFIINNQYLLLIPVGKSTNSVTGTNWEHKGVCPDKETAAEDALKKAHLLALKNIVETGIRTELTEEETTALIKQLESSFDK